MGNNPQPRCKEVTDQTILQQYYIINSTRRAMLAYNNTSEIERANPSIFQVQTQNEVTESDEIE